MDIEVVRCFVGYLQDSCGLNGCEILAYCFMPDHLHTVLLGATADSDAWNAIVHFKQTTGYWLKRHRPRISWQKDFYDHILRTDEDRATHIRYIVENPVRKGLVRHWQDYPFTGSLGPDLAEYIGVDAG